MERNKHIIYPERTLRVRLGHLRKSAIGVVLRVGEEREWKVGPLKHHLLDTLPGQSSPRLSGDPRSRQHAKISNFNLFISSVNSIIGGCNTLRTAGNAHVVGADARMPG